MLTDQFKVRKKILTVAKVGRPLMNIKLPTIAYLPPLEKACYPNEVVIRNYKQYESSQEFKAQLNCYLSKHPQLVFITFHRYGNSPAQVIFMNKNTSTKVAISLSEFREYDENKVGGYKNIAKSLDDILERR